MPETYEWATDVDVAELRHRLYAFPGPLLTVGSGGSFTAAQFASELYERATNTVSRAVTPLEVAAGSAAMSGAHILIISAEGRNPDILLAARSAIRQGARSLTVLSARSDSPLAKISRKFDEGGVFAFRSPAGRDGFLATNSLLGTAIILERALEAAPLPRWPRLDRVVTGENISAEILAAESVLVLFGPQTRTAAIDLESKMAEAALGCVLLADFRNFAHGRHHWIAKRGASTAVVSIESNADEALANGTLGLLPRSVPILRMRTKLSGGVAAIAGLVGVFKLTGAFGRARQFDPGRPGVPPFGRRIYHLRASRHLKDADAVGDVAITRKVEAIGFLAPGVPATVRRAYARFRKSLSLARFSAIVLDYDGTICSASRRFGIPDAEVGKNLTRLLREGLRIGVATGRGRSVGVALRQLIAREFWPNVTIGYYNGGLLASLADEDAPRQPQGRTCEQLGNALDALRTHELTATLMRVESRPLQLTISTDNLILRENSIWLIVNEALARNGITGVKVFSSSHSVDIVPVEVSKMNLVRHLDAQFGNRHQSLCIGDRGRWPGNDFELLTAHLSLSVDTVSASLKSCWNIAPEGTKGIEALVHYLRKIHLVSRRQFRYVERSQ